MKINPKRYLGQNFISDTRITDKIVECAGNLEGYNVIEIGPGLGSLTTSILKCNPKRLIAIEKDESLYKIHEKIAENNHGRYQIIYSDALKINFFTLCASPVKVIANLPYNIATVLLFRLLDYRDVFTSLTLMFQKEVADRIIAQPNNNSYGKLSILTQLLCNVEKMYDYGPEIFFPVPKVNSSVVNIFPLKNVKFKVDYLKLQKVLNCVFNGRRKMLKTTLKNLNDFNNIIDNLNSLGIDDNLRPENITIEEFCKIASII